MKSPVTCVSIEDHLLDKTPILHNHIWGSRVFKNCEKIRVLLQILISDIDLYIIRLYGRVFVFKIRQQIRL